MAPSSKTHRRSSSGEFIFNDGGLQSVLHELRRYRRNKTHLEINGETYIFAVPQCDSGGEFRGKTESLVVTAKVDY